MARRRGWRWIGPRAVGLVRWLARAVFGLAAWLLRSGGAEADLNGEERERERERRGKVWGLIFQVANWLI